MKTFEEFELTQSQIDKLKRINAKNAIKKYVKKYGVAPESTEEFYTYTEKQYEAYKKMKYAEYVSDEMMDDSPSPEIPIGPVPESGYNGDYTIVTYSDGSVKFWDKKISDIRNVEIIKIGNNLENCPSGYLLCENIEVSKGNKHYDSRENCNAIIDSSTNTLCVGCKNTIIPDTVTRIDDYVFWKSDLKSIIIPNSVTSIGECVFRECSSLESIIIPNSVTSIGERGDYAFYKCSSLKSITLSNNLTNIGDREFEDCSSLESIIIPNSVTNIDTTAFINCSSLTQMTIPDSVITQTAHQYPNSLPTTITNQIFSRCENLQKIIYLGTAQQYVDKFLQTTPYYPHKFHQIICSDRTIFCDATHTHYHIEEPIYPEIIYHYSIKIMQHYVSYTLIAGGSDTPIPPVISNEPASNYEIHYYDDDFEYKTIYTNSDGIAEWDGRLSKYWCIFNANIVTEDYIVNESGQQMGREMYISPSDIPIEIYVY